METSNTSPPCKINIKLKLHVLYYLSTPSEQWHKRDLMLMVTQGNGQLINIIRNRNIQVLARIQDKLSRRKTPYPN